MICKKCGTENPEENQFCSKCGKRIVEKNKMSSKKKKIIIISILSIVIIIASYFLFTSFYLVDLTKYSKKAQEILYAIQYNDINSLDSSELQMINNEILELSKETKNKEIKQILLNYHMGISMIADNKNTDNSMIIDTIKLNLEEAENRYQKILSEKNQKYEILEKKEEYKKIDNYKLSDLIDIRIDYLPILNVNAIQSIGTSIYTGKYRFAPYVTNGTTKEIKYIDLSVDICDKFKEKLQTKTYHCIGPVSKSTNFKFDSEYISDYKVAKYVKISSIKITYSDNTIITLQENQIDKDFTEVEFYY